MKKSAIARIASIFLALLIIGGSFFSGYYTGRSTPSDVDKVEGISNPETDKPDLVDFSAFWKVWNVLNEKFVATGQATTSEQEKVWGAIEGLAASLNDPYTVFLPPEENEIFQNTISGSFDGIGIEVGLRDKIITVISPLKDTPAYNAGVKPGDQILKIDDTLTVDMSIDKAVKFIRGKKGTVVRLTIAREGKKDAFEIKIVRNTIKVPVIEIEGKDGSGNTVSKSESGKVVGFRSDGVFVIKLYSFTADSPDSFRTALRDFVLSGSHKLIIDLRGNPGGYLEAAWDIASWFLPTGKLIVTEDFGGKETNKVYRSKGYDIFNENLKLVVLVDGGSASASEIFAGALREH